MKHIAIKAATLAIALLGQHVYSQLPAEVEGSINTVALQSDGSVVLQVMNMTINVPAGTPITSPSASLTATQLTDTAPLPGRSQPGFVGGTAIVTGTVDASGIVTAADLFVEPAENVALGVVTSNGVDLCINNVPVSLLSDARIPAFPTRNVFGFEIIPQTVAVGTAASVEGYFASGVFHAFLIEVEGDAQLTNPNPQISILRAESRERTPNAQRGDEVEVRGAITTSHMAPGVTTQTIRVLRVDGGVERSLGTTTATIDPATPGFAEYRFRVTTAPSGNAVLGRAPTLLRARNISAGANNVTAEIAPEVRN